MRYSNIIVNLLFKVDTRDCFGFALNDAINRYVREKVLKEMYEKNIMARY